MAGGLSNTIGVLVKGHNALSGALIKAEGSLTSFRKTAEATALSVNSKLSAPDIDTAAIDQASSRMRGMGTTAMVTGGIVLAGFGLATRGATRFNAAMAEVSTLVDTSTTDMGALTSEVRSLSKEFGVMPVDTAKAMYTTISAGFGEAEEATVMLEGAMKLARGGITDTNTAIDGLTSIMNSYGMAADQVSGVSDKMFVAMKAGKTTIGELSASLGKVTPLASNAGVSIDELLAATSALTLGGMSTSESVTALRGIMSAVTKPTSQAKKAAEQLGITFETSAIKSMGFANWLAEIKEKSGGDEQALGKLFGQVEGLSGVLALTGNQAGDFASILEQMGVSAGATEDAFNKMNETSDAAFGRAKANAAVLMDTIGDALLPVVSGLANAFGWVAGKLSAFQEAHPFLAKLVTVLVAVSAAVAVIGGAALVMGGKVMAAMAMVNMSTGGILLVIGALVTGITALVMYFTAGSESMVDETSTLGKVFGWLKGVFMAVATPIAYGVGFLVGVFEQGWGGIWRLLKEVWDGIKIIAVGTWNAIQDALVTGITYIVEFFAWAWDGIKAGASAAWALIKQVLVVVWEGIKAYFTAVWDFIKGIFNAALQALSGDWAGAWETIKNTFSTAWEQIKGLFNGVVDWISGLAQTFYEAGKGFVNAILDGIKAAWSGLVDSVTGLMGDLRDLLPFSDAKKGPLSSLTASGSAFIDTFASGMKNAASGAMEALSGVLGDLRDLLPFSDAKAGPLSELTKSGAAVMPTFASGIDQTSDAPMRAVAGALSEITMEPPSIPPPPAPSTPSSSGQKGQVVFEDGAFQITVNGADGLDDLEDRITEIFSRASMRLGVTHG